MASYRIETVSAFMAVGCCEADCRRKVRASRSKPCRFGRWRMLVPRLGLRAMAPGAGCPLKMSETSTDVSDKRS